MGSTEANYSSQCSLAFDFHLRTTKQPFCSRFFFAFFFLLKATLIFFIVTDKYRARVFLTLRQVRAVLMDYWLRLREGLQMVPEWQIRPMSKTPPHHLLPR